MLQSPQDSLEQLVRPPGWVNPRPKSRYHLVVIGAGTAGLVTAAGAAGLGATVALIERHRMGGDCLNTGCVPSKAFIASARAANLSRNSGKLGVRCSEVRIDFQAVRDRMRARRARLAVNDSAERFQKLGVDLFFGDARFSADGKAVEVGDTSLNFAKAAICTGSRPHVPPIDGLAEAGYHTNETIFELSELPKRLGIIGGGPIGCELAQTFARFGTRVTLFLKTDRLLPREDRDASEILRQAFLEEGIALHFPTICEQVSRIADGKRILWKTAAGEPGETIVDELLVAVGREPNTEGLNLGAAGIGSSRDGVVVNDFLQTTNRRVYAAGDVCTKFKFTHAADAMARIVIRNALFKGRAKASRLLIPWCTYTSPEVATVESGLLLLHDDEDLDDTRTFFQPLSEVDRAVLDGETRGFVKVQVAGDSDRILGATIVAEQAGEWISLFSLAMQRKIGLASLADLIFPYPTQAEAVRKLADQYQRQRLSPGIKKLLSAWFRWLV